MSQATIEDYLPEQPPKDFFRFLIVDDEPVAHRLLRSILEAAGYSQIDQAESGERALELLREQEYHLVVLDKNMPGTDGLEVLRQGRQLRPGTEFIMITAYGSMESAIQAMDSGAFSYITKPFNEVDLVVQRVERALEQVVVRMHNEILVDRLRLVVGELDRVTSELEQLRAGPPEPGQREQQLLARINQAVTHLRKIAEHLERLRRRASGRSAEVLAGLGRGIVAVARLLADAGSEHRDDT